VPPLAIVRGVVYKGRAAVISALLIFAATYLVLVTGELPGFRVYRTSAALIGAVCMVVFGVLPWLTPRFFRLYGNRPSELEAKFLLLCLLGNGGAGDLGR